MIDINRFNLLDIQAIPEHGMFKGRLHLIAPNPDGVSVNTTEVTVRIKIAATATFQEIEMALFEAARDHLDRVSQLLAQGTPQSLRQSAKAYRDEREHRRNVEFETQMNETWGTSRKSPD